ncbi:amidohydrolase [Rosistilla oblonga]|uniref:amidohydrolase n=1 Tax=Rosistilla oblonga TaxID=2527990 RepID=UPI003A96B1E9
MVTEVPDIGRAMLQRAQTLSPRMRQIRRSLHQAPELSEHEFATTAYLADRIAELNLTPQYAGGRRGVWADIDGGAPLPGRRVAMRGDIDALPLQTQLEACYASQTAGVMHACGHDAHATMVWGATAILKQMRDAGDLPTTFASRSIFQPAEETSTGGIHMIDAGALQEVHCAIALHVDPSRNVGTFGFRDLAFTAGCDVFEMELTGKAGHGARPHLTGDTVGAAAAWIHEVYSRLPRSYDARDPIVVNVGQIQAGSAANIVPAKVSLGGTVRTLSIAAAEHAKDQIDRISQSLQLRYPVEAKVTYSRHTPPVINDPLINAAFRIAAGRIVGEENVHQIDQPSMGAEDFAFFGSKVPAAMMRIGVAGIEIGQQPLHTPTFDIDEAALPYGAAALALAAIDLR